MHVQTHHSALLTLQYYFQISGGRTPSYGYMTPSHDPSCTPSHGGSAWDPSSAATPARTDDFDYTASYDTPSPAGVSYHCFKCLMRCVCVYVLCVASACTSCVSLYLFL